MELQMQFHSPVQCVSLNKALKAEHCIRKILQTSFSQHFNFGSV